MMKQAPKTTYHPFITGPILRFDDRNSGFSQFHREQAEKIDMQAGGDKPSSSSTVRLQKGDPSKIEKRKGFGKKDYALSWAGRTIDYLVRKNYYTRDSDVADEQVPISDRSSMALQVKTAAKWLGADGVGICEANPAWIYSHWGEYNAFYSGGLAEPGEPIAIPSWLKFAVVMIVEMDYADVRRSPALDASTSMGYSKMSFVASSLATYIRQFGYHALPSGNDYALNIPLAIDAGLGELGRNGQLMTADYGPRVRICKVFTDLPLAVDRPVDLGVQAFCEICKVCADHCPSNAIMKGERTDKAWDESNSVHVLKWPTKAMKCMHWWDKNGSHCSNCIRVCPFNKPKGWHHSLTKAVVKRTSVFDRLLVSMDKVFGYGKQVID